MNEYKLDQYIYSSFFIIETETSTLLKVESIIFVLLILLKEFKAESIHIL